MIPLECLLLEGTWDDNPVGVMNDGVSLDDAVFVLVGHRVFLGLKSVILCLLFGNKLVGDWEVGVFLVEACVCEKYLIAGSIFDHREAAERVGNNVGFAGKINDFWPILFNNQPPAGDAVGCEVGEGKIFVVGVNNNLLARKDGSVLA